MMLDADGAPHHNMQAAPDREPTAPRPARLRALQSSLQRSAKALGVTTFHRDLLQHYQLSEAGNELDGKALNRLSMLWLEAKSPHNGRSENGARPNRLMLLALDALEERTSHLQKLLDSAPQLRATIVATDQRTLRSIALHAKAPSLLHDALHLLHRQAPGLCANLVITPWQRAMAAAFFCALLLALWMMPTIMLAVMTAVTTITFLAILLVRATAASMADATGRAQDTRLPDADLPIYTILIPLYREANQIRPLVASLMQLDYPHDKLDIKLLIEADDHETLAMARRHATAPIFDLIPVPVAQPRTKPKALNYGLQLARGSQIVVYDAEDRPERGQLREAVARFRDLPADVGCLQGRLAIDNGRETFFTKQFAAEYAGLFDVLLPALARFHLPIPLGGTSNHFRRDALERAGGWDPYNVTEDADLGMRLHRFGWTTRMLRSATYEEAPDTWSIWLNQRTRWFKGWMQTWLVHMRRPQSLWADMGPRDFVFFQIMVLGMLMAALLHPFMLAGMLVQLFAAAGNPALIDTLGGWGWAYMSVHGINLIFGYGACMAVALVGLERRGLQMLMPSIMLIPIYWLCLSYAAWRAMIDLIVRPFHWAKTPHGRTPRDVSLR